MLNILNVDFVVWQIIPDLCFVAAVNTLPDDYAFCNVTMTLSLILYKCTLINSEHRQLLLVNVFAHRLIQG